MADTNFITAEKIKGIIENQIIDNKDFVSTKKFKPIRKIENALFIIGGKY